MLPDPGNPDFMQGKVVYSSMLSADSAVELYSLHGCDVNGNNMSVTPLSVLLDLCLLKAVC